MKISELINLITSIDKSLVMEYLEYLSLPVLGPCDESDDINTQYLPGQICNDYKLFITHYKLNN